MSRGAFSTLPNYGKIYCWGHKIIKQLKVKMKPLSEDWGGGGGARGYGPGGQFN